MDFSLTNKTALVTGSYRGTGLAIAKTLLAEGANVLVHGITAEQANAAVSELAGGTPVSGDISAPAGCQSLLEACAEHSIQILINNYGGADQSTWLDSNADDWHSAFEKNVLSAQRLTQALLPSLLASPWARIINIGTVGSTRPNSRMPAYYAAKGALATMTMSLAKEVAGSTIRVNLVSPGIILTPEVKAAYLKRGQAKGWGDDWSEIEARVAADIPTRRITRRDEVAALVAFLCSEQSNAIHGQNLRIDGGQLDILT